MLLLRKTTSLADHMVYFEVHICIWSAKRKCSNTI